MDQNTNKRQSKNHEYTYYIDFNNFFLPTAIVLFRKEFKISNTDTWHIAQLHLHKHKSKYACKHPNTNILSIRST